MRDFILIYSASSIYQLTFMQRWGAFKLLVVDCYQSFLLIPRVYWIVLHHE